MWTKWLTIILPQWCKNSANKYQEKKLEILKIVQYINLSSDIQLTACMLSRGSLYNPPKLCYSFFFLKKNLNCFPEIKMIPCFLCFTPYVTLHCIRNIHLVIPPLTKAVSMLQFLRSTEKCQNVVMCRGLPEHFRSLV